ncbi:MAG: DUF350 domain-containing protein [Bacteroidales bacterium]|nr:DUF350 domain-containing protein [Bacteroidales bacterium]
MKDLLQNEIIITVAEAVSYVFGAFIMFFIGKLVYDLLHKKIDVKSELVEKDNFAFSIAHTGYLVGLLLAIGSSIVGPSNGILTDFIDMAIYGGMSIILLNLSIIICDKVILRKFSVYKEIIEDQNEGTGVVEAAVAIASGLIIFGAVSGESGGIAHGILTAVVFWAVGQVVLILTSIIYNLTLSYNVFEEIEKDNVAVGVAFAGILVAIANLIRFAVSGDFISWSESFANIGIELIIGLLLLPVVRFLADRVLLPGRKITDELVNQEKPNIGVALIEAFAYIGGSVLITWCI